MPAAYSDDLRQKVLQAIEQGEKKSQISRIFKISRNTIDLWLKRHEQTGTVQALRTYDRGPQPKIKDLEAFRQFVETHNHLTHKQMAELWPDPVSSRTIGKAIQRLGLGKGRSRRSGTGDNPDQPGSA